MITIALLLALQAAPDAAPPEDANTPAKVEAAIRASLRDPDSAKFTWPYGPVRGTYKPILGRKVEGMIICGTVNAKNGYGGYTGAYAAIGVMAGGYVLTTDMDSPNNYTPHAGWVADQCRKAGEPVL